MKYPTIFYSLGIISTFSMGQFSLADSHENNAPSQASCYSKATPEGRSRRAQDIRAPEPLGLGASPEMERVSSKGDNLAMASCDRADQRMELLIFLLQIMRGPK